MEGMSLPKASNQLKQVDIGRRAREAAEAAARRAQEEANRMRDLILRQQQENERRRAEEAAAAERAREAARQAVINRKRDSIRNEKDYNVYFVESVAGSQRKLLNGMSIVPGANNIISFMIDFRGVNPGNSQTNNWNQVIGLTADPNGGDQRYLGVWIYPGTNTLHIRTETDANGNDNISRLRPPLERGITPN
jgi:hypothetical protein